MADAGNIKVPEFSSSTPTTARNCWPKCIKIRVFFREVMTKIRAIKMVFKIFRKTL